MPDHLCTNTLYIFLDFEKIVRTVCPYFHKFQKTIAENTPLSVLKTARP